ncbi:hypothetical protein SCQ32_03125 [Streptococcus canis]|uniref:hypothetical protein n=1 Tax=Streptococcus canis TaxID=1329 RepID=UPI00299A3746|nr:hypothetical protein [Streptococcus canis]
MRATPKSLAHLRTIQSRALVSQAEIETLNLSYRSHVQNIGWQELVAGSEDSGTVTNTNQVEATSVQVNNPSGLSRQVF